MAPRTVDDKFNDIIQGALGEAADVECSAADYRANLKVWIDEIRIAIMASEQSDDEG